VSIICHALARQMEDLSWQAGSLFLEARICALVEAGRLELQGESTLDIHASQIRLQNQVPGGAAATALIEPPGLTDP
jgi:hypothetical protein